MRKNIIVIAIIILASTTILAQGDLSKDKDYQNFKRNYERASKGFENIEDCKTERCKSSIQRFTTYSRKFLDKLIIKYGQTKFSTESAKIKEIEKYFSFENNKAQNSNDSFKYVGLWLHRLSPNMLNNLVAEKNLIEFDKAKLVKAYESVKQTEEYTKRFSVEDRENLEMALNDFENYLKVAKVFDEKVGLIGRQLLKSKTIQDKEYFEATLTIAQKATNALLIISPNSPSLKLKLKEINAKLNNADAEVKLNTPKLVKKYKNTLPKAIRKDKDLEKQFIDAIKYQKFPGITITGAIITDSNWVLTKSANGRTLYRMRDGIVTAKNADGECWFQNFSFKQFYTGSGFGRAQRSSSGERFYIKCSLIK